MQPIRQIFESAPDVIPVPVELLHRRVEFTLRPLDEPKSGAPVRKQSYFSLADMNTVKGLGKADNPSDDYERTKVGRIVIPSREVRNARP